MDELRKEFERLHPVPRGITWDVDKYVCPSVSMICLHHNILWRGFQSGHAAGMERAAGLCDNADKSMHPANLADFIRAAKEQK